MNKNEETKVTNVRSIKKVRDAINSKMYSIQKKTIVSLKSRRAFVVFTNKNDENDVFKVTKNLMSKALQLEINLEDE